MNENEEYKEEINFDEEKLKNATCNAGYKSFPR